MTSFLKTRLLGMALGVGFFSQAFATSELPADLYVASLEFGEDKGSVSKISTDADELAVGKRWGFKEGGLSAMVSCANRLFIINHEGLVSVLNADNTFAKVAQIQGTARGICADGSTICVAGYGEGVFKTTSLSVPHSVDLVEFSKDFAGFSTLFKGRMMIANGTTAQDSSLKEVDIKKGTVVKTRALQDVPTAVQGLGESLFTALENSVVEEDNGSVVKQHTVSGKPTALVSYKNKMLVGISGQKPQIQAIEDGEVLPVVDFEGEADKAYTISALRVVGHMLFAAYEADAADVTIVSVDLEKKALINKMKVANNPLVFALETLVADLGDKKQEDEKKETVPVQKPVSVKKVDELEKEAL
jgi:hypothetical protein